MTRLPLPEERLAGCCWLPRLAAKIELNRSGKMPVVYRIAFGNRLGVDGMFLRHFGLSLEEMTPHASSSEELAAWFTSQPTVTKERIDRWNALAPKIGTKGHPGYFTLTVLRPVFYPKSLFRPVCGMFDVIVQDEQPGL